MINSLKQEKTCSKMKKNFSSKDVCLKITLKMSLKIKYVCMYR